MKCQTKSRQWENVLWGITLQAEHNFIITKAINVLLECIYVALQFRSSPLHNSVWAVRKCLAFIRRSASYHRTAQGVSLISWQQVAAQALQLWEMLRMSFHCNVGQSVELCSTFIFWLPGLKLVTDEKLQLFRLHIIFVQMEAAWLKNSKFYSYKGQKADVTLLCNSCWVINLAFQQAFSQWWMEPA